MTKQMLVACTSIFVIIVLVTSILVPLNESCADIGIDLEVEIELPEIGFLTVGDNVPVDITITNNSNETRYFVIETWFTTDKFVDPSQSSNYEARAWIAPSVTRTFHHTFLAEFPEVWWLIVAAHEYESLESAGLAIGTDRHTNYYANYYVHPSSDRDIRLLADSTTKSTAVAESSLEEARKAGIFPAIAAYVAVAGLVFTVAATIYNHRKDARRNQRQVAESIFRDLREMHMRLLTTKDDGWLEDAKQKTIRLFLRTLDWFLLIIENNLMKDKDFLSIVSPLITDWRDRYVPSGQNTLYPNLEKLYDKLKGNE